MTTDLVEQLSRAVCEAHGYDADMEVSDCGTRQWQTFQTTARAVLSIVHAREIAAARAARLEALEQAYQCTTPFYGTVPGGIGDAILDLKAEAASIIRNLAEKGQ